jgi:glycosyltransferase involved in cell wall biosynthesis
VRIVHVATADGGNGAAIGAYRIHEGLRGLGVDSKMFVAQRVTNDPDVVVFQPRYDLGSRLRRRFRRTLIRRSMASYRGARSADMETFSDDRSQHGADVLDQLPAGDIIHVHGMLDFLDYRDFLARVLAHTPVVRTLHDISFFTGGCHYSGDCDRFTARCGACPQLGSTRDRDLSRRIWQRKHEALENVGPGQLHVVANSAWTGREAKRSSLLRGLPVTVIPYALDTETFRPRARDYSRAVLGISPTSRVVLFVAEPVSRRLKGFARLVEALDGLGAMRDLLFVSVGGGNPPAKPTIPHLHLGQIRHPGLLSLAYSAADVFVIPSAQEAFGLTALESTACGTPVIGFAVGGIVDTVRHGETGMLVPPGDVAALRTTIRDLLESPATRDKMSMTCRQVAVTEYTSEVQARRYAELYRAIHTGRSVGSVDEPPATDREWK